MMEGEEREYKTFERAGGKSSLVLSRYWHLLPLLMITGAAVAVRFYYLSFFSEYSTDSYYFMILARSIRDSFSYTVRGAIHTKYLPGFPVAIWLLGYALKDLEKTANVIAVLCGSACVPLTYLLGKEAFNRLTGLIAALIIAFIPTFLKITCVPMSEGMFTLLLLCATYLLLTGCKRASVSRRVLGAIAGGLAFVTRWEGALFLPVAVAIVLLYRRSARIKWWEPPVLAFIYVLPVGVYVARNLIATGSVTLYMKEYEQHKEISFAILKHRFKVYAWQGLSSAPLAVFMYVGGLLSLVSRRWKAFLMLATYFGAFVFSHMFWYYAYERFMAPAAPVAAVFIGYSFFALLREAFDERSFTRQKLSILLQRREEIASFCLKALSLVLSVCSISLLIAHSVARSNRVIYEDYQAFSDDHGGRGMVDAAKWLERNAPGQPVAVDAGPYFSWLYDGDVLYVRPVPWDLPVEDRDVDAPNLVEKLYIRGIRYLVVGQTDHGVEAELVTLALRSEDLERIREVARWSHDYVYPEPHTLETVIYELLPAR